MITINTTAERIIGTLDGTSYNIPFKKDTLDSLYLMEESYEELENGDEYQVWLADAKAIIESAMSCKDEIELIGDFLTKNKETGKYFITGAPEFVSVPQVLVDKILYCIDKELDPTPIIRAFIRFCRTPNICQEHADRFGWYITNTIVDLEQVKDLIDNSGYTYGSAVEASTYNDVMLTNDGAITTYKYGDIVKEIFVIDTDGDGNQTTRRELAPYMSSTPDTVDEITGDITPGEVSEPKYADEILFLPPVMGTRGDKTLCDGKLGYTYKIGHEVSLIGTEKDLTPVEQIAGGWKKVNCNYGVSCVNGLHIGGRNYVEGYGGKTRHLLMCFVDPAEIGAIVTGGDGAIRVRAYFPYGIVEGKTKGMFHAAKYLKFKDEEWAEIQADAIANINAEYVKNVEALDSKLASVPN